MSIFTNSNPSPTPGENLAAADPRRRDAAALSSCAGCRPDPVALDPRPTHSRFRFDADHWHVMAGDNLIGLVRELQKGDIHAANVRVEAYIYCCNKESEAKASPDGKAAP